MITMIFSEDNSMSSIMLRVQGAQDSDFPIEIKIGPGTFKIQNAEQAQFFSLGIMAYLSSLEEKEKWDR